MYQSLESLELTPVQRDTLNFLIKQAERYEKVRKAGWSMEDRLDGVIHRYYVDLDKAVDNL